MRSFEPGIYFVNLKNEKWVKTTQNKYVKQKINAEKQKSNNKSNKKSTQIIRRSLRKTKHVNYTEETYSDEEEEEVTAPPPKQRKLNKKRNKQKKKKKGSITKDTLSYVKQINKKFIQKGRKNELQSRYSSDFKWVCIDKDKDKDMNNVSEALQRMKCDTITIEDIDNYPINKVHVVVNKQTYNPSHLQSLNEKFFQKTERILFMHILCQDIQKWNGSRYYLVGALRFGINQKKNSISTSSSSSYYINNPSVTQQPSSLTETEKLVFLLKDIKNEIYKNLDNYWMNSTMLTWKYQEIVESDKINQKICPLVDLYTSNS